MGGDYAPQNVIAGALDALRESQGRFEVLFVGPESVLGKELRVAPGSGGLAYQVVDASQIIEMHDPATVGLKGKRNSSISVGLTLHKEGKADAFVSAGHSGAVMSTSTLVLGRIAGIGRPTIGAFLPSQQGVCLLVDAGVNVDCKPQHLYEFGLMGSVYASDAMGVENPTVGLLSIGEEESKGNEAVRDAYKLFRKSRLNFIGNVEGRDILEGKAHVVVCDGFVGNVILKFAESVPGFFKDRMRKLAERSLRAKVLGLLIRGSLRSMMKSLDYEEYGGVPILGVNGVSIIGHGKSTPKAIKSMIFRAEEMVRKNINRHIQEVLSTSQ
jgi:glycerol-3-phosphate acyltransferase PlsX